MHTAARNSIRRQKLESAQKQCRSRDRIAKEAHLELQRARGGEAWIGVERRPKQKCPRRCLQSKSSARWPLWGKQQLVRAASLARAVCGIRASRVAHQAAEESAEGAPQQIAALLNWDSDHAFRPQFTKHTRHAQWRNRIEIFHGKSIVPQLG